MGSQTIAEFAATVGSETGVSRWFDVPQVRISGFAELTEDHQAIHVDPVYAAATPFGGTIAHGFLVLSLLSAMLADIMAPLSDRAMAFNYGFEKIRFVSPVRAGSRIRGRVVLSGSSARPNGDQLHRFAVTVEIDGEPKPAMIAEWLVLDRPINHRGNFE